MKPNNPVTSEQMIEQMSREMAVDFYDGVHGYTFEFAPHPESHRVSYDFWQEKFAERLNTFALAMAEQGPDVEATVEQRIANHLRECRKASVNSNSDFNQGVQRGLEIAVAQIENGHTRAALGDG